MFARRTGCRIFKGVILLILSFFATKYFANESARHVIEEVYDNHFQTAKSVTHMRGEQYYDHHHEEKKERDS
jgi:hypothetical protein